MQLYMVEIESFEEGFEQFLIGDEDVHDIFLRTEELQGRVRVNHFPKFLTECFR